MRPLFIATFLARALVVQPRAQSNSANRGLVSDPASIKPSTSLRGSTFQFLPGDGFNVRSATLHGETRVSDQRVAGEIRPIGYQGWIEIGKIARNLATFGGGSLQLSAGWRSLTIRRLNRDLRKLRGHPL
jgi:hypothetical protein